MRSSFGAGCFGGAGGTPGQEKKVKGKLDKRVEQVIMVGSSGLGGTGFGTDGRKNKVDRVLTNGTGSV